MSVAWTSNVDPVNGTRVSTGASNARPFERITRQVPVAAWAVIASSNPSPSQSAIVHSSYP